MRQGSPVESLSHVCAQDTGRESRAKVSLIAAVLYLPDLGGRTDWPGDLNRRTLWRARLRGGAADARVRDPHHARRAARAGVAPGDARGVALTTTGVGLGLGASLLVGRAMESMLVEIRPTDPFSYLTTIVVLCGASLAACWIPARRATRVDPVIALRHE